MEDKVSYLINKIIEMVIQINSNKIIIARIIKMEQDLQKILYHLIMTFKLMIPFNQTKVTIKNSKPMLLKTLNNNLHDNN